MEALGVSQIHAAPAHEISVRVSAPDAPPVDVHIKEQGGEVRVAVRTADTGLQASLRHDLGTLVDRLEQTGFRAEALPVADFSPRTRVENLSSADHVSPLRTHSTVESGVVTNPGSSQGPSHSSDPEEQPPGQNQSDTGARQQSQQRRQNSSQHMKWKQAMEDEV